jgi:ferric-dicitrate binding protein FerR (iron transport regulator)
MTDHLEQLIRTAGARPTPGDDRAARVRAAVELEWRAQTRARAVKRWTGVGIALLAAGAAVFLAVRQLSTVASPPIASLAAVHGAVTIAGTSEPATVGQAIAGCATVRTSAHSRGTVTLAEGAEIRMDAGTTATLVDAHTVRLESGAIYIESGGATPCRFTVVTASGTIRDIGTRFEVRQGKELRVRVRDGAVQLERAGSIERALKGTELLARADGTVSTESIDPFSADWAWTTAAAPTFVVEGATLEAFLQWAVREGGWMIEWSDAFRQRARAIILSGTIDGMTPAEALEAMLPTAGLAPEFVHGTLRIRPVK